MSSFLNATLKPSPQEMLVNRSRNQLRQAQAGWRQLEGLFADVANWIWSNPLGFDPQAVLNQFGTSAGDLFIFAQAYSTMAQAVTGTAAVSFVPAGWSAQTNADGSVTVTKTS